MIDDKLADMYLDWCNNYLGLDLFAEHNGIAPDHALTIINMGRVYHNARVEMFNRADKE